MRGSSGCRLRSSELMPLRPTACDCGTPPPVPAGEASEGLLADLAAGVGDEVVRRAEAIAPGSEAYQ